MYKPQLALYWFVSFLFFASASAQTPLAKIALRSIESESDAVIVVRNDEEIFRYLPLGEIPVRVETMSMTKSFASLAIGFLVDEKKIPSVDEPLTRWFPEWKNSPKKEITLRHILTQTSGLDANRDTRDIYQQDDFSGRDPSFCH